MFVPKHSFNSVHAACVRVVECRAALFTDVISRAHSRRLCIHIRILCTHIWYFAYSKFSMFLISIEYTNRCISGTNKVASAKFLMNMEQIFMIFFPKDRGILIMRRVVSLKNVRRVFLKFHFKTLSYLDKTLMYFHDSFRQVW